MANYAVSDFTETADDLAGCLALVEAKLDSITNPSGGTSVVPISVLIKKPTSVLAALPPARRLGLYAAGEEGTRGIHRGNAPRRQADRPHHFPRRPSQPSDRGAAAHRPDRQGSA